MPCDAAQAIPFVLFKTPRQELENAAFLLQVEVISDDLELTVIARREGKEIFRGLCIGLFPLFPVVVEIHYPCQDSQVYEQVNARYTAILAEKSSLTIAKDDMELILDNETFEVIDAQDDFFQIPIVNPNIEKEMPIKLSSCLET